MSGAGDVLIVDDNAVNLKLARVTLESAGIRVRTASDAGEALAAVRAAPPALILMDVQLPGVDGLELTRRLKADPATRSITVLALTAYAMKGDDRKALEAGCDGYLTKPIDTRALPEVVRGHLARRGALDVLIIEDNPSFGKLLRLEIESLGLKAELVPGLDEAREALARAVPRLVITDRRLGPGADGWAFCAELKAAERTRAARVILLSGSDEAELPAQGPRPDLCLRKDPESLRRLPEHIRSLLP